MQQTTGSKKKGNKTGKGKEAQKETKLDDCAYGFSSKYYSDTSSSKISFASIYIGLKPMFELTHFLSKSSQILNKIQVNVCATYGFVLTGNVFSFL